MANFSEIINSEQPVLIDFYADWCGPCKTLSPIIQEVAKELNSKSSAQYQKIWPSISFLPDTIIISAVPLSSDSSL